MNRLLPLILLIAVLPLQALEIRLNDKLFGHFTTEDLKNLTYTLREEGEKGIYLNELLPLMEETTLFRLYTGSYILKTDPSDDLRIVISEDQLNLKGKGIGILPLPEVIELEGTSRTPDKFLVWMDKEDVATVREMGIYAKLHQIDVEYRFEKNIVSLLEYNSFNGRRIPDIIIFSEEKLNSISPLLDTSGNGETTPLKFSRQIFLNGASGGNNRTVTGDFGSLELFYPLLLRFGMNGDFTIDSPAVRETLFYLKSLFDDGLLRITTDPFADFLSGRSDGIYGPSTMMESISGNLLILKERNLPHLGGENPVPLKSRILLSSPRGCEEGEIAANLISYLTGYGVQQRISPATGYLPADETVYPLLAESDSKRILMENLESSVTLNENEINDKLRYALARVYRPVVTGRVTIGEGLAEIGKYLEE